MATGHWSTTKKAGVIAAAIVGFLAAVITILPYATGSTTAPWVPSNDPVAAYTLDVVTDTSQFQGAIGRPVGNFVFPDKSSTDELPMPDPPTLEGAHKWATDNGGMDNLSGYVQFFLGAQHGSVQLIGAKVNIIDRLPDPAPGGGLIASCQCGDQLMVRNLSVFLDNKTVDSSDEDGRTIPIAYTMNDGDVEMFVVHALNNECGCSWNMTLSLLVNGEPQAAVVDDHGEPFKLMAVHGPSYNLQDGAWVQKH